jgi:uncharacterized ion transporter superfamily protein YfcC
MRSSMSSSWLRRIKIPHVFVLLSGVIFVCSILTYVVPSGSYDRQTVTIGKATRTVMVPGTYRKIPKHISFEGVVLGKEVEGKATPVSFVGLMTSIPRGMENVSDIIFLIFLIGGVFGIIQRTGTIAAVIHSLLNRFSNSGPMLTVVLMTAVAIGGSTLGMGEELIPLVPIFLLVSAELGYDRIYGLALVSLAAEAGFAAATTNPFTVQIAQGIAEVPLGSGISFRIIFFAVCMFFTITYVLRYGRKIRRDPSKSIVAGDGISALPSSVEKHALRAAHVWIVVCCGAIFGVILYAMQARDWWLNEMSGGFLLMGVIAVIIARLPVSEAVAAFVKGMEDMVVAAMVVGFARGIQVVMLDGEILDTIIHSAASLLQHYSKIAAAEGMLAFQTILNFFIPSGSGQAAVTMPLMAPLSDILGITRQTAVFAFTCGDGFSNMIIPTSGILMAMLSLAKIPYEKWLRFAVPMFLQLIVVSGIFLAIAVLMNY